MNRRIHLKHLCIFLLFITNSLQAACLCGPGVPCNLFLSSPVSTDDTYVACERVYLQPGFYVNPTVDVRLEAGLEISFDVETGAAQESILSAEIIPALACEGDADFDQFNQCMDCDDFSGDVYPGALEVCDGVDNDCDPASPDGWEDPLNGASCDGEDSDFCLEGIYSCSTGSLVCSDNTSDNIEICDGQDNDCDNLIDEDVVNTDPSCPTEWLCTGTGGWVCDLDSDATISPGPLAEPIVINQSTSGTNVAVLDFNITDGGTSDSQPTIVSEIVVDLNGTGDASEHIWTLNGPDVTSQTGIVTGTAPNRTLSFSGLSLSVADGTFETYAIALNLNANPVNTVHRDDFQLFVSSDNITLGNGTAFGALTSVSNGGGLDYFNFSIGLSYTDAGCEGMGTASVAITGGRAPVTVIWEPTSDTSLTTSNLVPGTYTVTATDNGGDSLIDAAIVTSSCVENATTPPYCPDDNSVLVNHPPTCDGVPEIPWSAGGGVGFTVNMEAGRTYTISTCNAHISPNILYDTVLTLFDPSGGFLISNDDMGATCALSAFLSKVSFVAPVTGTFKVNLDRWPCLGSEPRELMPVAITCE